jgi:OmpA-OmpF porin, OOP family
VVDLSDTTPVANATVDIYIKDKLTNEKFLVKSIGTDSLGNYATRLEPTQDYLFIIRKTDFLSGTDEISTRELTASHTFKSRVSLGRKPKGTIIIPNIEYEFNSAALTERSTRSIDSVLYTLLEANPDVVVEIRSHTDSKGNDNLNMKLSQKRAESVIAYLTKKGVDARRMQPKGFGESMPVAPNENSDGSDNPEGRARNRRTEFQIIGTVNLEFDDEEVEVGTVNLEFDDEEVEVVQPLEKR